MIARIEQNADGCGFDLVRDPDTGRIQLSGTEQQRQTSLTIMSVFSNRLAEGGDELPARRGYWGDYLLPRIAGSEDRLGSKLWTLSREVIRQQVGRTKRTGCDEMHQANAWGNFAGRGLATDVNRV
ncbi:phage GP46 family protein [Pseudodesulfovibrio senegalensis]|uniref:Uncharacterized protein n=1 Tax=Pseudodesulfovibrio senegalensis TaxID=1721087 RepID=A0A6N6N8S6_9BACT|nr:phage GP46 family protein [Pseudodesulfovibrio senegalensis]KAB1443629.1 hypothetical protein F8A88_05155 [Pseudodesulfovibrio senegalensis]